MQVEFLVIAMIRMKEQTNVEKSLVVASLDIGIGLEIGVGLDWRPNWTGGQSGLAASLGWQPV